MSLTIPLVRTPSQILNNMISDYQATMFQSGYTNVNVDPGSDVYIIFKSVADQVAITDQSVLLQANADMPDTATGDDLTRLASTWGLTRRSASSAVGYIAFATTNPTAVVAGSTLTVNSLSYQVVIGGVYSNGQLIFVQAVSSGAQTNQALGTTLTWSSGQPLYALNNAICATALTGGADAEDDASLRNRLLSQFANPPSMGNWQDIINLAISYDPLVANAFVYSICNGPGTFNVALVGYQTTSDVTRVVPTNSINATTAGLVANLPIGLIPGLVVTTITPETANVAFQLALPLPSGGNSQGWVNAAPWPVVDPIHLSAVPQVQSVTSTTVITINVTSIINGGVAPIANLTSVCWIDRSDDAGNGWLTVDSIIAGAIDNGNNTWTLTLQTPLTNSDGGVAIGDYIFPSSANEQTYLDLALAQYAGMGPGQMTNSGSVLPFAYRQPLANNSGSAVLFPDTVGVQFLQTLEGQVEVATATFAYNSTSGNEPALPASIVGNPSMWIPQQLGFYKY